jgi:hypothetical protein
MAMLGQAGCLAYADGLTNGGIPTAAAFEEDKQPGSASRYRWRNGNIRANLDVEGGITFHLPNGHELGITFPGAKPGVEPLGESASYPVSYYLASAQSWQSGMRWERVRYRQIYPGIDLVLLTNGGQLEYNLEIRPGADPSRIRIRYHGAAVQLNKKGDLVIRIGQEEMLQRRAFAFQDDFHRTIECAYHLEHGDITLRLGRYDPRRTLTIDPVLNFSTYLGGPYYDAIYALAADSAGNVYLTGETSSGSLSGGSTQPARSSRDAWVAKLNSSGSQLLYLVYLGGSGNDSGRRIAVDSSGNAYVTGMTASADFPTTSGAYSTHSSGLQEAFVSKVGPTGQLQYSTYLGGGSDAGFAIAVDNTGAVYVAGQTASVAFPVTAGTIQATNQGGFSDCFVSKLNAAGASLLYSTYLGGSAMDLCTGIAIDVSGDAYVTGTTYSSNFPTALPMQSSLLGSANAFVAEVNPTGSGLLYSTYLGGSGTDNGNAIAVDSSGAAYVAGSTSSVDFPTTAAATQTVLQGLYNAFVSKLAPDGSGLSYSTYIGGSGVDNATAIAVDSSGQAVAGGYTTSPNFPVSNAIQTAFQGGFDAFATVLSATGSSLVFSSYFGGTGDDRGFAVAALPGDNLALGGMTASTNFLTTSALQSSIDGGYDGFALNAQYETVQSTSGLAFYPLAPCRIADTRVGSGFSGAFGAPFLSANTTRTMPIQMSACGVPVAALAYSLNVAALPHEPLGFLTVWPAGITLPLVGTLGSPTGQNVSNAALVPAGTGGAIDLFANADTDVIIDINGYLGPANLPQALALYLATPCRVADTRTGSGFSGAFGAPSLVADVTRTLPMPTSACSLPSIALGYSLNIGAFPHAALGFLTVWPAGASLPVVGTLGSASGIAVSNAALVPSGTASAINLYANAATDVVVDVNGYFGAPGSTGAVYFYPLTPCRVADTRTVGSGKTGAFGPPTMLGGTTRNFPIPMSTCSVPSTAQAYSLNIAVLPPGPVAYMTTWAAGQPMPPLVTMLGSPLGESVSDAAIVGAGTGGAISIYVSNTTDVIIDIDGYFAP